MILIYIVCAGKFEADRITSHLLSQRLAACTNMFPIESAYWWEGKIHHDNEVGLIVKTVPENFDAVRDAVLKLHSYQTPCIIEIPVNRVEANYLNWLHTETRPAV